MSPGKPVSTVLKPFIEKGEQMMKTSELSSLPGVFLAVVTFVFIACQTVQATDTIRAISTGVGIEERQLDLSYSTQLVFSNRNGGSLLTNIHFIISTDNNNKQQILEMKSAGPWVFADLSPGRYTIKATRIGGRTQSARFTITRGRQSKVILSWE